MGSGFRETRVRILIPGYSLAVQWLGLCAFTAGGSGLIPGQGIKSPQATQHGQKKKNPDPIY